MSILLHLMAQHMQPPASDTIIVPTRTITTQFVSGSATAGVQFQSDGDIIATSGTPSASLGDWIDPKGSAPGLYEIRATVTSGTLSSGTANTWQALTSSRTWSITSTNTKITQIFFEIRDSSGAILDDGTITLELDKIF